LLAASRLASAVARVVATSSIVRGWNRVLFALLKLLAQFVFQPDVGGSIVRLPLKRPSISQEGPDNKGDRKLEE